MKAFVLMLVFIMLVGSVTAQYDDSDAQSAKDKASGTWFGWIIDAFSLGVFSVMLQVAANFLFVGGIAAFAFLAVMQYLGFDLVGWTIDIFKFIFDNVFLLIRWTLSTEANLISMVILFIILWLVVMGYIPSLFEDTPDTIEYKTVVTTSTTLKSCEDGIPCGNVCCALNQECKSGKCTGGSWWPLW